MSDHIEKSMEGMIERRREELHSNAEYQRRSSMTSEERARDAKERITKNIFEHMKQQQGEGKASYAEAERKAEEINRRYVREVEGK